MTNQEIADFLAGVMGWTRINADSDSPMANHAYYDVSDEFVMVVRDWHPATDLNQAMQAAEKVATDWAIALRNKHYLAECGDGTHISTLGPADALSRAVVKAAGGKDA